MHGAQHALRRRQAREQWALSTRREVARRLDDPLGAREMAPMAREALGSEQLAEYDVARRI
jgi:hypothetical protein